MSSRDRRTEQLDLGALLTEQHRGELADLDVRPTLELVRLMNREDASVPSAVAAAAPAIARAIDGITARLAAGGRLVYQGAGSAGRLGILDAAECGPTFNTDQVVAVMAGGERAVGTPAEALEDSREAGADDLRAIGLGRPDALVAVSASGRTPYVLGGVDYARSVGALTVGLACNPGAALSAAVEHPIEVVVGPELIAGSTRLKAGTAQKLVLNMISTLAMVKLGNTYGNLMVEVRATNEKLRARARRVLMIATGEAAPAVETALDESGGDVKVATVMLLAATDASEARRRLERSGGRVRDAIAFT